MTAVVFAGPSLGHLWSRIVSVDRIDLRPPARRGDIDALLSGTVPSTLVLADGSFNHEYAVGHRELLRAIEEGWRAIGVSSMGAIRACELRYDGMEGYGRAYRYLVETSAPDDHLALTHQPEPPFRIFAEALFDVRHLLMTNATSEEYDRVAAFCVSVGSWWFADRTLPELYTHLLEFFSTLRASQLLKPLRDPLFRRAKQTDLVDLLRELDLVD